MLGTKEELFKHTLQHHIPNISSVLSTRWCGGAIGRALDLSFIGYGFESCLGTIVQWP